MYAALKPIMDRQAANLSQEEVAENLVDKAWTQITSEWRHVDNNNRNLEINNDDDDKQLWTTVMLFISSTFRDMNSEREYVIKKVLPELFDWAEKLGIRIVECDLRWGVPPNSSSIDTIEACLGELELIKTNTKCQPLFLCLLGDRYGWIPNLTEIPEQIAQRYGWIDGLSITHMEILQGAIRCKNRNALCCFRSPDFVAGLPADKAQHFVDTGLLEQKQLTRLKSVIDNFLPEPSDQLYCYKASLNNDETSSSDALNVEFQPEFGHKIVAFFKAAISRLFPGREAFEPPDEVELENFHQRQYLERRCESTFGIEEWTGEFVQLINDSFPPSSGQLKPMKYLAFTEIQSDLGNSRDAYLEVQAKIWPSTEDPKKSGWLSRPICLVAKTGRGKSSLMSSVAKAIATSSSAYKVFFHFCDMNVTQSSTSYLLFLKRLVRFLCRILKAELPPKKKDDEDESSYLMVSTQELLVQLQERSDDVKAVLLIDAVENLRDLGDIGWQRFLPIVFPSNCLVVMSTTIDKELLIHGYFSLAEAKVVKMPEMSLELRSVIVTKFFEAFNKRLSNDQLSNLISNEGAHVPLWLMLACEELRVFGNFRRVNERIASLDSSLDGLLTQIFSRLIAESPNLPVGKFLSYLATARRALPEEELPLLLGQPAKNEKVLPLDLAKLRLVLKSFIRFMSDYSTVVVPFHSSLIKAAPSICDLAGKSEPDVKQELAIYMIKHAASRNKRLWSNEIPQLLWESDCRKECLEFFQYDPIGRTTSMGIKEEYLRKFRCQTNLMHSTKLPMRIQLNCCIGCSIRINPELNNMPPTRCCWICKSFVPPLPNMSYPATVCTMHVEYNHTRGEQTCAICRIFHGTSHKWTPLQLCRTCSLTMKCCHVSVEQSLFRFALFRKKKDT